MAVVALITDRQMVYGCMALLDKRLQPGVDDELVEQADAAMANWLAAGDPWDFITVYLDEGPPAAVIPEVP